MKREYYFDTDHVRKDLKSKAVKGAGATVLSQGAMFFVQMAGTVVLARLLTPEDFGIITMVTIFSLLVMNFGLNGFTEAVIQRDDLDHNMLSALFWINATISGVLTVLFMAAAPLISWFFSEPSLKYITIAVALSIISTGLSTIHLALLKRNMQFQITAGISVAARAVSVCTAIVLALYGWKYWALAVGFVLYPLSSAAGAWLFCGWRPGIPRLNKGVREMVRFALNTYGNFTLNYFSRNLDNLLVGKFLGSQALGFYKKAYDLFALSMNQLTAPLTGVAVSAMSRTTDDPEKFRRHYLNAVSILSFIGMAISAMLTLTAKDVILLLLGPQWNKSAEIFAFFGPGIGIMLVYGTHGWLHLSLGRADRWLKWGIAEFVFTGILFIIGLRFGATGVAAAWTISYYILLAPSLWYAGRPAGLKLSMIIPIIAKYFVAALFPGIFCWYILVKSPISSPLVIDLPPVIRLLITCSMYLISYVAAVIIIFQSREPIMQIMNLLSVYFKRSGKEGAGPVYAADKS